jgi:cellulose synthase (UDP-forming)
MAVARRRARAARSRRGPARDPLAWFDATVVPVYVALRAVAAHRRVVRTAAVDALGRLARRANGVGRHRWMAPLLLIAGALMWAAAGICR